MGELGQSARHPEVRHKDISHTTPSSPRFVGKSGKSNRQPADVRKSCLYRLRLHRCSVTANLGISSEIQNMAVQQALRRKPSQDRRRLHCASIPIHSGRVLSLKKVSTLSFGSPNHFTYRSWNSCEPNNSLNARSTTRRKSASFRSRASAIGAYVN